MDFGIGSDPNQNPRPEINDIEKNGQVEELIKTTQLACDKLKKSPFYAQFMEQMNDPEMVKLVKRTICTDPGCSQLQLVLYCVGRIVEGYSLRAPNSHLQLAFAILLRERFEWVSDIVVYDPELSASERTAINAFNCTCRTPEEQGSRGYSVDRPTLFFMPYCPVEVFDIVVDANANLKKIIILGNSFKGHLKTKDYSSRTRRIKVLLDNDDMLREIPLPQIAPRDPYTSSIDPDMVLVYHSFERLSWHFFNEKDHEDSM